MDGLDLIPIIEAEFKVIEGVVSSEVQRVDVQRKENPNDYFEYNPIIREYFFRKKILT